jgi:hypothetical protein
MPPRNAHSRTCLSSRIRARRSLVENTQCTKCERYVCATGMLHQGSVVPTGLCLSVTGPSPALKRWAKVRRPFETGAWETAMILIVSRLERSDTCTSLRRQGGTRAERSIPAATAEEVHEVPETSAVVTPCVDARVPGLPPRSLAESSRADTRAPSNRKPAASSGHGRPGTVLSC